MLMLQPASPQHSTGTPSAEAARSAAFDCTRALARARRAKTEIRLVHCVCHQLCISSPSSALTTQLQTPPAPMHAPICTVLLAICARVSTVATALLDGSVEIPTSVRTRSAEQPDSALLEKSKAASLTTFSGALDSPAMPQSSAFDSTRTPHPPADAPARAQKHSTPDHVTKLGLKRRRVGGEPTRMNE